jgi:hypothetical protein
MEEQHSDTGAELSRRASSDIAAIMSLWEAIERARYYNRTGQAIERGAEAIDQLAERAEDGRIRDLLARTADPDWLAQANFEDLAQAWGTAHGAEGRVDGASASRERVEGQLRQVNPDLMTAYDAARANGSDPETAMTTAVERTFGPDARPPARPHPGRGHQPAITTGPDPYDQDLEPGSPVPPPDLAALRSELIGMGPAGEAAAELSSEYADAAFAQALQTRADRTLAYANAELGTPDDPRTAGANEHHWERAEFPRDAGAAAVDTANARSVNPFKAFYSADTGGMSPAWTLTAGGRPARTFPPGASASHTRSHPGPNFSR